MQHLVAPFVRTDADLDPSVTRIPFSAEQVEEAGFYSGADVRLYSIAAPIFGIFGEVVEHVAVSVAGEADSLARGGDGTPSVLVLAVDADGIPFPAAPPLACVNGTEDVAAVFESMNFVDLTPVAE